MVQIDYYINNKKITLTVSEDVATVLRETDQKQAALIKQDTRHLSPYMEGRIVIPTDHLCDWIEKQMTGGDTFGNTQK